MNAVVRTEIRPRTDITLSQTPISDCLLGTGRR